MNSTAMTLPGRREWRIPAILLLLSLVPATAGTARLAELVRGADITEANARFIATPLPVVLHILSVIPFSVLGPFQFLPRLRRRRLEWHRAAGRCLVILGMIAALTGLWMSHFYPWPPGDGWLLYGFRIVFGSAMVVSILMAVGALRRQDFASHGAWMIRAYAIGMGAGTQVLTHLPWLLLVGTPAGLSRAVLMGAGWVINLFIAELAIRRSSSLRRASQPVAAGTALVTG